MDGSVKEKLQQIGGHSLNNKEAEDQRSEAVQEGQPERKRDRRKRLNKNSGRPVNFNCPWELDARLDNYRANRKRKEERIIKRTEVIVQALDQFLTEEGYPPTPKNS